MRNLLRQRKLHLLLESVTQRPLRPALLAFDKNVNLLRNCLLCSRFSLRKLYTGNTYIHEKGDFFLVDGESKTEIKEIDPIWLEILSTETETPAAKLKRKITGW